MHKLNEILYKNRFAQTEEEINKRNNLWKELCKSYFQDFIKRDSAILEIGAGYCEFINNIEASKKIAVDINDETSTKASKEVTVYIREAKNLDCIRTNSIDVVFASNFFEHITKEDSLTTIHEVIRVLKPNGILMILGPNMRYVYKDFWMFWDHISPTDDRAIVQLLTSTGFFIRVRIPKFLPYTTKSKFPKSILLMRLYLKFKFLWKLFGSQFLIVAEKCL